MLLQKTAWILPATTDPPCEDSAVWDHDVWGPALKNLEKRFSALLMFALIFVACDDEAAFVENVEKEKPNSSDQTGVLPGEDSTEGDVETTEGGAGQTEGNDDGNNDDDPDGDDGSGGPDNNNSGHDDGDDNVGDDDDDDDGGGPPPPTYKSTSQTFDAQLITTSKVTAQLDQAFLTQEITLETEYKDITRNYQQITRASKTDNFTQGNSATQTSESFNQLANRPLDILVVIDNSGSMSQEQAQMANKLQPLLTSVADTDWAIGVVTTDPNKTCLREHIQKGDANIEDKFRNAINAGTNGSGNERGILTAVRSLAGTCLSQPWIRNDSTLAVLIVSDEDNCSAGNDCSGKDYQSSDYLTNYLNTIRVAGSNARVYGLFWHPSQDAAACSTADYQANIYSQSVTDTNGTWGSICDADYGPTLEAMSQNIQEVLGSRFTLSQTPESGSVSVTVNGAANTNFTVNGKVIQFSPAPADGSVIAISYGYGAAPMINNWDLRYEPVAGSTNVTVNGTQLTSNEFSVNTGAKKLTLVSIPNERATISVSYTRNEALTTAWTFFDSVEQGSMKAYVDNVETQEFSHSTSILGFTTVTFGTAPADSSAVKITYKQPGIPVLSYPFNAEYGVPVDLRGHNKATNGNVRVSYNSGNVTVHDDDWADGMTLVLTYDNIDRQELEVPLPQEPLDGSVTAKADGVVCKDSLVVTGQTVYVDNCNFVDASSEVDVEYDFLVESYTVFEFSASEMPEAGDYQKWEVFLNGTLTTDYSQTANVFTFPGDLPAYTEVKVRLTVED